MNLLICTQAVDRTDPALGFFHSWIEQLATRFDNITVLALRVGEHSLPSNVEVIPLGHGRLRRMIRILHYSVALRGKYDAVFVHMSQEFVLLAGWLWKLLGKTIYLWRNHYAGTMATNIAARMCKKVFCTSKYSYTARYSNTVFMPVGIDTELFTRLSEVPRDPRSILFLGRIAPSKKPQVLLQALGMLKKRGVTFAASFYGSESPQDAAYAKKLRSMVDELNLSEEVSFKQSVPNRETPAVFNRHAIFVNCSPSGMYDKTLFEAASCECAVVAASKDFAELVDVRFVFEDGNADELARKIETLLSLSVLDQQGIGAQMRNIARPHSVTNLMDKLAAEMH
ncbi:MAG: glycosyltransferase family 4 protein [Candidatus Pacebacteria bacterium]|nr:glycosyltransferase family 4 protein [Candidatus Paceibacterota bacterium]